MAAGDLYINGVDAWTQWGVFLEEGSTDKFACGVELKAHVENKSKTAHGKQVLIKSMLKEERDFTVVFCFRVSDAFWTNYNNFISTLMAGKVSGSTISPLEIRVTALGTTFKVNYVTCTSLTSYVSMGKVAVKFNEPNPDDRL